MKYARLLGTGLLCLLFATTSAAQKTPFGEWFADLRLRYEAVEQDNTLEDATAKTLRGRLGFTSNSWNALQFSVQAEAVTALGDEDYNSGPDGNGHTSFSVIPDPEGEQINQLWLGYNGLEDTQLKLGRQRLIYDNARFVGNVGWRQNEQTYDALTVGNESLANTRIQYAYLSQVNNIFFQEKQLESGNLLNLKHVVNQKVTVTAYAYYLDYEPTMGADSRTLGLSMSGLLRQSESYTAKYRLEYATQSDYADAASDFSLDYQLLELSLEMAGVQFKAGQETLQGDGLQGFATPLATLHAFNGWSDQFLTTPASGLQDLYLGTSRKLGAATIKLIYHDFASDISNLDFGSEWNAAIGFSPSPGWSLLLKYADYNAADIKVDTEKLWLQAAYRFD